jgi:hypothetical protein
MHDDWIQANQFEQHHIACERGLQDWIGHRVAAVFDHHGLVPEPLDVGQGFGNDFGFVARSEIGYGHGGFSELNLADSTKVAGLGSKKGVCFPAASGSDLTFASPISLPRSNMNYLLNIASAGGSIESMP